MEIPARRREKVIEYVNLYKETRATLMTYYTREVKLTGGVIPPAFDDPLLDAPLKPPVTE